MIDMHSHILPQVDDGSRSVNETFEMMKEAHKNGFQAIICTPHYYEGFYEKQKKDNQKIVNALTQSIRKEWNNFDLYLGNEIYLNNIFADLILAEKMTTLAGSKYALFEFSINEQPMDILELVDQIFDQGYVPVLAHPERYKYMQRNLDIIYNLVSNGVLLQCNYGSIIGMYGRKTQLIIRKLLEYDMVTFMGSDAHRQNTIYSRIPEANKELYKVINGPKFREITDTNPMKVIRNEEIRPSIPKEIEFTFAEKRLLQE